MATKSYYFDGRKAVKLPSIGDLDKALEIVLSSGEGGDITERMAYESVAYIYRAVTLRAQALSSIPFVIEKDAPGTEKPQEVDWPLRDLLPKLFWLIEASLCCYGEAYILKLTNRAQRAGIVNGVGGLKWLVASTIEPKVDKEQGLTGFERRLPGAAMPEIFTPDQVIWFWLPDPDVEVGPGCAPVKVALDEANVSMSIDTFAASFFKRGAIPGTILQVDGPTSDEEIKKLETWWKRLLAGASRAWQTVAVRAGVKPIVIGSPAGDLAMAELDNQVKHKICAAMGLPESMMDQAANYATKKEDRLSFYQDTVIPSAILVESVLNEHLFKADGLRLRFHPESLDIMQEDEQARATSLKALTDAGLPLVWAVQMLGMEAPAGRTWDELEKVEQERKAQTEAARQAQQQAQQAQPEPQEQEAEERSGEVGQPEAARSLLLDDLRRWREKAKHRGADQPFESDVIPAGVKALITERLAADADHAFGFLKQLDEATISAAEAELQREVARALENEWRLAVAAIIAKEAWDEAGFAKRLANALDDVLARFVLEQILREAVTIGIDFDSAVISAAAWDWARTYTYNLVTGLTETTRTVVQDAIAKFVATPGMTNQALRDLLSPAFGDVRAAMIGITEVTRSFTQGVLVYQDQLAHMGLDFEDIWATSKEKVCVICESLDGKPRSERPDGVVPPRHVSCRCWLRLRVARRKAGVTT